MHGYNADLDACVEPVLTLNEATQHPHNRSVTVKWCVLTCRTMCTSIDRGRYTDRIEMGNLSQVSINFEHTCMCVRFVHAVPTPKLDRTPASPGQACSEYSFLHTL